MVFAKYNNKYYITIRKQKIKGKNEQKRGN